MTDSGNSFGRGVYVKGIPLNVWTPCPLHETYRIIDKRKEQSASISASPEVVNDGVNDEDMECDFCAFDHIEAICLVERDFYWYRFFSYKGQISKCMHIYEVREGDNNVIDKASASDAVIISSITNLVGTDASAIDMPTSETSIERISRLAKDIVNRHRVKKKGPCHICRSTTTAAKFWHTSPITNPWPGIAADMVLCQKCAKVLSDLLQSRAQGRCTNLYRCAYSSSRYCQYSYLISLIFMIAVSSSQPHHHQTTTMAYS
jgi:hypothetical protein